MKIFQKNRGILSSIITGLVIFLGFLFLSSISNDVQYIKIEVPVEKPVPVEVNFLNAQKFIHELSLFESATNYEARRPNDVINGDTLWSQYWGRYQFGEACRICLEIDHVSWDDFKKNTELQDAAMIYYIAILNNRFEHYIEKEDTVTRIRNIFDEYSNKVIRTHYITNSGLVAMAHNIGISTVVDFLDSGCKTTPKDGFETESANYLALSNFDLTISKDEAKDNLDRILKKYRLQKEL
jgi:ferritin-like metal-binding protein YciE